jgi:hypothetical protein
MLLGVGVVIRTMGVGDGIGPGGVGKYVFVPSMIEQMRHVASEHVASQATSLTRIMHTLNLLEGKNERNMMGPQNFRALATTERTKQTALRRTAPTPMRWHDLSTYRSGAD